MLEKSIKDHRIVVGAYDQWLVSNYGIKESMDSKIMATKLNYKVDELSSSSAYSYKSINELKISVAYAKKASNTAISKIGSIAKKWRSSEDYRVQGGCTPE